ncbi:hypothetical protein MAR_033547, partial [Mya arenaria]
MCIHWVEKQIFQQQCLHSNKYEDLMLKECQDLRIGYDVYHKVAPTESIDIGIEKDAVAYVQVPEVTTVAADIRLRVVSIRDPRWIPEVD